MLFASTRELFRDAGDRCACFALRCAVTMLLTFARTIIRADLTQSSVSAIWFQLLTSAKRGSRDLCRYFTEICLEQEGNKCRGKAQRRNYMMG
jgi:hypothetical protein